jgi:hypothetical protein
MVLDEKTHFLLKINNLRQQGQKLELTKKVNQWLNHEENSPFNFKPNKRRSKTMMSMSMKDLYA